MLFTDEKLGSIKHPLVYIVASCKPLQICARLTSGLGVGSSREYYGRVTEEAG